MSGDLAVYERRAQEAERLIASLTARVEVLEKCAKSSPESPKVSLPTTNERTFLEFANADEASSWAHKADKFWLFGAPWFGKVEGNKIVVFRPPPLSQVEFEEFKNSKADQVPKRLCSFEQYYAKQLNKENKLDGFKISHGVARDENTELLKDLIGKELKKYKTYAGPSLSLFVAETPEQKKFVEEYISLFKSENDAQIEKFLSQAPFTVFKGAFQAELRTILWRKTKKAKEVLAPKNVPK